MTFTVELPTPLTGSAVADSFGSKLLNVADLELIARTSDTQTHRLMTDSLSNPTLLIEKYNVLPATPARGNVSQIRREFRVETPFRVYDDESAESVFNSQYFPATASLTLYIPRINGITSAHLRELARSAYEATFTIVSSARSDTLLNSILRGGLVSR